MKNCKYSQETQDVLIDILRSVESLRVQANNKNDFPCSDYPYRPCQAIIAEHLGFEHRAEWSLDTDIIKNPSL